MTAAFYKTVYNRKFEDLPSWKKLAILEDSKKDNWSGILTDFVKAVIEEAEKEYANSVTRPVTNIEFVSAEDEKPKKALKKKS